MTKEVPKGLLEQVRCLILMYFDPNLRYMWLFCCEVSTGQDYLAEATFPEVIYVDFCFHTFVGKVKFWIYKMH